MIRLCLLPELMLHDHQVPTYSAAGKKLAVALLMVLVDADVVFRVIASNDPSVAVAMNAGRIVPVNHGLVDLPDHRVVVAQLHFDLPLALTACRKVALLFIELTLLYC
jgi:hypothetical protein